MAYRWETADSVWLEQQDGQFELSDSRDLGPLDWSAQAPGRLADLAQLLGAALPASCAHAAIYPEGFAFCPQCGQALRQAAPAAAGARRPAWWGASSKALAAADAPLPRHVPHGLPITALPLAASLETRPAEPAVGQAERKLPTPPNALCVFAAAHFGFAAPRLLALAYSRNALQYWDPLAARWLLLAPQPDAADLSFTRSDYAWLPLSSSAAAPARRGDVAVVPSAQGLLRLRINPLNESYATELLLAATLVAAPGALGRQIACLIEGPAGVRLWSALPDGGEPELQDCVGAAVPLEGWSRPFSYDGKLIWLHAEGHLVWLPGTDPQWLPWPQGWQPRLQFGGPVKSRHGLLWLIGHDGHSYCFLELGRLGGQIERIGGARLGFGTLLFRRGHQVKDEPWEQEHVEDQTKGEALVLPLLENVSSTRSQPCGLVLRIEHYPGTAEAALDGDVLPRTFIEWVGQRNVILDEVARLTRPGDCVPFVYDGCLWLHHPKWNEIRGWHLKAAA